MQINPADGRTPSAQIADAIWKSIQDGRYSPGQQLPPTRAIADEWGVSHTTALKAIADLRQSGAVETRSGAGTFVKQDKAIPTAGAETHDLIEVTEIPASADIVARLGTNPDDWVVVRRRLIRLDGIPAGLIESYYPADLVRGTPLAAAEHYPSGTVGGILKIAVYDEEAFARMPTPTERQQMHIGPSIPVLGRWRVSYDAQDRPVQVTRHLVDGSRYTFKHRQQPTT